MTTQRPGIGAPGCICKAAYKMKCPIHGIKEQTTMTLLQKLRALAATEAKATPAPWVQCPGPEGGSEDHKRANQLYVRLGSGSANAVIERKNVFSKVTDEDLANATLIAESRNLLKAALALVEAQHEALEWSLDNLHPDAEVVFPRDHRRAENALKLANQEQP